MSERRGNRAPEPAAPILVKLNGPFNLSLSLEAAASFLPPTGRIPRSLRLAIQVAGRPIIIDVRQPSSASSQIAVSATVSLPHARLEELALWLTSGDLDLRQFHRITATRPVMGPIAKRLWGLKPLRPASLFEMAIIAITEQQLSLAAAFHIRKRLIERFGRPIEDLYAFPTAGVLAKVALRDLRACGLSHRKAEYVRDFARCIVDGGLMLEAFKQQTDTEVRDRLMRCRGIGIWSVQYFLLRGLGRYDCLPSDDIGLRRTVGTYLSHRRRLSPAQLERALSSFAPFRGLAAFYLAVDVRLQRQKIRAIERRRAGGVEDPIIRRETT